MKVDPEINPIHIAQKRKSIRLKGYDYSQAGGYFVTIVTYLREDFFGEICDGEMLLSDAGKMIELEWEALRERFQNIETNMVQVMPNHIHGILLIHTPTSVGAGLVPAHDAGASISVGVGLVPAQNQATTRVAPTIGEIVGAFKSITTHKYIQGVKELAWPGFTRKLWQRNYYEHIIRNQEDYERIAGYIQENPMNWNQDEENPQHLENQ